MAKLSQKQIASLWIVEGGHPDKADLASAISMAESSGDTKAGNSCCHGIYQFNVEVGVSSMKCALNPVCATRKAISMSKQGTDWSPWEAFTNGAYLQFLGKSGHPVDKKTAEETLKKSPVADGGGGPFGIGLGDSLLNLAGVNVPSPLSGIDKLAAAVEAIARLIENMFTAHFWVRFGKGLLGALLFIYALQGILKATLGMEIPLGNLASSIKP